MKKNIALTNQNCMDFLPAIESDSVGLIIIDPPYQISQHDSFSVGGMGKFHSVSLDFGEWDYNFTIMEDVIKECYRILKPTGTLICFYDIWKMSELKSYMEQAKFKQIRFIEWLKTNPVPLRSTSNYLTTSREIALVSCKVGKPTFNSSYDNGVYSYGVCHDKDRFHPTQKPVNLIEDLIIKHSNKGDLVLDCFAGSGTTAIACINTERNFIGCELDSTYYQKSKKRISQHKKKIKKSYTEVFETLPD